jgi:hypothetical protein
MGKSKKGGSGEEELIKMFFYVLMPTPNLTLNIIWLVFLIIMVSLIYTGVLR